MILWKRNKNQNLTGSMSWSTNRKKKLVGYCQ